MAKRYLFYLEVAYSLGSERFLDAFSKLVVMRSKGQELFACKNKKLRSKTKQSFQFINRIPSLKEEC